MAEDKQPFIILIADDDADDRLLIEEALLESNFDGEIRFVEDGEALLDYLHRHEPYTVAPRPHLILLDLNMPRKDGREALREIKAVPHFRKIPIVVLTTSMAEEDILNAYALGVNSYITKPVSFNDLLNVMSTIVRYWFGVVWLPHQ